MSSQRQKAERFVEHLAPLRAALEGYGRRALADPGALEDVIQSAVASAYRDFDRYAEGTNFRAWIFRYLNGEILNRNRKHQRHRHEPLPEDLTFEDSWELAVGEPAVDTLLDSPHEVLDRCNDALTAALLELSSDERAVLLLRAIGDFAYREIADILGIPIGTVMSRLARARLRVRHRLAENVPTRQPQQARPANPTRSPDQKGLP